MSAAIAEKRKPFGKSAENALNSTKQPIRKVGPKHDDRGGTSTAGFDPNATESRRDSKTPKMGNLTSAGSAYDLNKECDALPPRGGKWVQHVKTAGHRPVAKRDPSPTKRPDPKNASAMSQRPTTNRPDKSTKRQGSSKERDGFVAASLKRLFSSKDSTVNHPRAKSNNSDRLLGSSPVHTSSHMKMAGLVMSPLTKPDPIAKDEGGGEGEAARIEDICMHVVLNKNQAHVEPDPRGKPPSDTYPQEVILVTADIDDQPRSVPKELLDRFRNGPTDDKRILDAMFKSGSKRPSLRPRPIQYEASMDSLVGSMVGGASLQRSDSIDESEVTTIGFIHEDSSQASMTTRFDRVETDRSGVQSYLTNESVPPAARNRRNFSNELQANAQSNQDLSRANTINDRTTSDQSLDRQTYLPAGWRVRWSKTKQQPYWVHPDFGSTWHCPGLTPTVWPKKCQHELYHDKSIFEGMQIQPSDNPRLVCKSAPTSSESDTASHMWRVLEYAGTSVKSIINEHAPMNAEATSVAQPIQTNRCNSNENFLNYADAGWAEEKRLHREANDSENLDVSSVEASAECFTQDFECYSRDEDEMRSVAESYYDETKRKHDVEYEYDQLDSNDVSDGRNYHSEVSSQEPPNADENDAEESIDREDNNDDDGSSLLENTLNSGSSSAINSLMIDYVDVDALLKNGATNTKSTLSTIKENNQSLEGYQTSEDSNDGSRSLQKASKNLVHAFEESSDGEDTSVVEVGAISVMENDIPSSIRFDSDEDGRTRDGYERKRRHSSGSYGSKKKFFPPGPLCSLQFLEEIEKREFDTPTWRRTKRKRSTLTSVRAQKHRQRRSSFH